MHEHQQNQRIAAARAFMESLEQLHNILTQEHQAADSDLQQATENLGEATPDATAQLGNTEHASNSTNSGVLEEVAADLDEFFGDAPPPELDGLGEDSHG